MADKVVLEAQIDSNIGDVTDGLDKATKSADDLQKATKKGSTGFGGMKTAIKGVGTAIKAAGIGIVVALFAKLMEVFSQNQKVVDTFKTTMTALSIAFNDLFKFLDNNSILSPNSSLIIFPPTLDAPPANQRLPKR